MHDLFNGMMRYIYRIGMPVRPGISDLIEIILIAFFVYQFLVWIQYTRAYTLLKGILVVAVFLVVAYIFHFTTVLWIVQNLAGVIVTAMVIIFQPELRRALEQLGQKNLIAGLFSLDIGGKEHEEVFTDKTLNELVRACYEMASVKTGALIVIEREVLLADYERTGISLDAILTSQLLINIFEKNTPLHDGAVIVRGNRIVSATCYLPLSDNMELSKQLGTRHRAGVGISEISDSLTIIVSEETGKVSVAVGGKIRSNLNTTQLREILEPLRKKKEAERGTLLSRLKGRVRREEK